MEDVEIVDEYYRRADGTIRWRRLIAGRVVLDSDSVVIFARGDWPWDRMGASSFNALSFLHRALFSMDLHLEMMRSEDAKKRFKAMESSADVAGQYFFNPPATALVKEGPKAIVKIR